MTKQKMRNPVRTIWPLISILLLAFDPTSQILAQESNNTNSEKPLYLWVFELLDKDETSWDRWRDIMEKNKKKLAFHNKNKELVILDHEIPDSIYQEYENQPDTPKYLPYSADASEPPVYKNYRAGANGESPEYRPYLSSGGLLNLLILHPFLPGHYEVTKIILNEKGKTWSFPGKLTEVVADASQDPDFFEWTKPQAHAQTGFDETTLEVEDKEKAQSCFFHWVKERLVEIKALCKNNEFRNGLYQFGRVLHGVQDLGSHRGISNAVHSWLARNDRDPDAETPNIEASIKMTKYFIKNIAAPYLGQCFSKLKGYQPSSLDALSVLEAKVNFTFNRDLTLREFMKYKSLGKQMERKLEAIDWSNSANLPHKYNGQWFSPSNWSFFMKRMKRSILYGSLDFNSCS